jgi:hypothetical protein
MDHFWIKHFEALGSFYHIWCSIRYKKEDIVSLNVTFPQEFHSVIEKYSDKGVVYSIKNFGIKKEYVTRTVSKERANNDICYISASDIRCFINRNPNLIVAHSTSNSF